MEKPKKNSKKILKKTNQNSSEIKWKIIKTLLVMNEDKETIAEGTKVKLNIDKIKAHPMWKRMREGYKDFVNKGVDKIFTVEYDKGKENNPSLVCLKEDTNTPKWLFFVGDLVIVEEIVQNV